MEQWEELFFFGDPISSSSRKGAKSRMKVVTASSGRSFPRPIQKNSENSSRSLDAIAAGITTWNIMAQMAITRATAKYFKNDPMEPQYIILSCSSSENLSHEDVGYQSTRVIQIAPKSLKLSFRQLDGSAIDFPDHSCKDVPIFEPLGWYEANAKDVISRPSYCPIMSKQYPSFASYLSHTSDTHQRIGIERFSIVFLLFLRG